MIPFELVCGYSILPQNLRYGLFFYYCSFILQSAIEYLIGERPEYKSIPIPSSEDGQKALLRGLLNVREPKPIGDDFLRVQDEYLCEERANKGVVRLADLSPLREGMYLFMGDITTLAVDAIVNAANSGMTGCYVPNHTCIDNCIHTYAGVQLRLDCAAIMARQGHEEATGGAKITPAYNLPCRYVLHTVGPIVGDSVTDLEKRQLASCYNSCLELAEKNGLDSVAFCCISTGVFRFPNRLAAQIAVETVAAYKARTQSKIKVIFNVFKDLDHEIYRELLK